MTTFDEAQHPRELGGRFASKRNSAPRQPITPPHREFQILTTSGASVAVLAPDVDAALRSYLGAYAQTEQAAAPVGAFDDNRPGAQSVTSTFSATTCPADTTLQYQSQIAIDGGSASALTAWGTTTTRNDAYNQGHAGAVTVNARCISAYAQGPASTRTATNTRPIDTPGAVTASHSASAPSASDAVTWTAATCPAGTTAQYQVQGTTNKAWGATSPMTQTTQYGAEYTEKVDVRCVYGSVASGDAWSNTVTWAYTPPAPAAPSFVLSASSVVTGAGYSGTAGGISCPAGSSVQYQIHSSASGDAVLAMGATTRAYTATGTGTVSYYAQARCVGDNGLTSAWGPASPTRSVTITAPPVPNVGTGSAFSYTINRIVGAVIVLGSGNYQYATDWRFEGQIKDSTGQLLETITSAWLTSPPNPNLYMYFSTDPTLAGLQFQVRVAARNGSGTSYTAWQ